MVWSGAFSASLASVVPNPRDRRSPPGICQTISAAAFKGKRVEYSLQMRTRDIDSGAHILLRAESASGRLVAFYNMYPPVGVGPITGTTPWTRHLVVIDIPESANIIVLGVGMQYTGAVWIDDVELAIVGRTIPLTSPPSIWQHSNEPSDATTFASELMNPDFEETMPRAPRP